MPLSEAALSGIAANGLRWRHEIKLATTTSSIGRMTAETPVAEIEQARTTIVATLRRFVKNLTPAQMQEYGHTIDNRIDDLEMVDADLAEVRGAMSALYDEFDFYRIVIV